jgi:uncharacterized protein
MKRYLGKPLYSATDLLNFLGCTHSTALDLGVLNESGDAWNKKRDEYLDLLKQKGLEHEQAYLRKLKKAGRTVVEIQKNDVIETMAEQTRQAMRDGADVIYQGALTAPGWHGYSDFLLRVETKSDLGTYSYEVADTKLARSAKPKHVVQLCVYSELVRREQGVLPEHIHVMLGDESEVKLRLRDFIFYCNRARYRFETFAGASEHETAAERCAHCGLCHWSERCDAEWQSTGNLRLVAGMSAAQAQKLRAAGILSLDQLGSMDSSCTIAKMSASTVNRLRSQAALQMVKRATGEDKVEILPSEERRGFARLPKPSVGDLFFDMEGDPAYSTQGSLEYLFGFHYLEDGENQYQAFWARNRSEEKKAFEDALDFIASRLEEYPDAFIYHYAAYEQTALKRLAREYGSSSRHEKAIKRLAQSYGTRENEVDDLLRNRKFVDLYKVVREAVRTSEPAYSLKNLEVFFAEKRTQEITSGGDSVVAFERWLKSADDSILNQIQDYNEFDCAATRLCRDWLLSHRSNDVAWLDPEAEKRADDAEAEQKRRDDDAQILQMREKLVDGASNADVEWRELLGFLLEYHRREDRSEWWQFFERCEPDYDAVADAECLGAVTLDDRVAPRPEKKSTVIRLKFSEQDSKFRIGSKPVRTDTRKEAGEIRDLNESEGWLDLKVGPSKPPITGAISLIPGGPLNNSVKRDAIRRYAQAVSDGSESDYSAVTGILRRDKPCLDGHVILRGEKDQLGETVETVARMKNTHLVIQGPPGCGKTFTSAHAIVSLINAGKRVGITSLSHKAINNLLAKIEEVAEKQAVAFEGVKIGKEEEYRHNGSAIEDLADNAAALDLRYSVVGGTAWLFSRPELDRTFDYLFIDEAGQVSLADVVATGLCADNIVLVGDQMQLSQPTKGQHPGGSGVSGLDYLMRDWSTVPVDRGIFLEKTWRMHPRLCRFVSDAFYDGRLSSADCTVGQKLELGSDLNGILAATGLRFVPVLHSDNTQKSTEEAMELERAYRSLMGQEWVNQNGEKSRLGATDILVVSPYNMQVNLLKQRLGASARVGTVDKFQGQEAAVVLVSMASSSADDAPRGIDFLFSRNRLNVALSRARCLSVVFCSPALLDIVCTGLERMKLVNTVCWANDFGNQREQADP